MYSSVPNYEVEFFTPPYNFLAPADSSYPVAPRLPGLGSCCSSCATGGGSCKGSGVGMFDGAFSEWGWQEYTVIGMCSYALLSMFFTGRKAYRYGGRKAAAFGKARRQKKRASLQKQLDALGDE